MVAVCNMLGKRQIVPEA